MGVQVAAAPRRRPAWACGSQRVGASLYTSDFSFSVTFKLAHHRPVSLLPDTSLGTQGKKDGDARAQKYLLRHPPQPVTVHSPQLL